MNLREAILDHLKVTSPTFPELVEHLDSAGFNCRGEQLIEPTHNLLICLGVSEEFAQTIIALRAEELVSLTQVSLLDYLITSPSIPTLPIVDKNVKLDKPRWVPVRLNLI